MTDSMLQTLPLGFILIFLFISCAVDSVVIGDVWMVTRLVANSHLYFCNLISERQ